MILNREPVLFHGVIMAAVALATAFWLDWTGEQVALVETFTIAVLSLIARQQVSPTHA